MGHNGSLYDYVIHVTPIAQLRASLITSFQPPLAHLKAGLSKEVPEIFLQSTFEKPSQWDLMDSTITPVDVNGNNNKLVTFSRVDNSSHK